MKATLLWSLLHAMVHDFVFFAVLQISIMQTTAINQNVCPRVLFMGVKVHYKEHQLTFGDYVEVYDGTNNACKSRNIPCITLYPCANATQSWEL